MIRGRVPLVVLAALACVSSAVAGNESRTAHNGPLTVIGDGGGWSQHGWYGVGTVAIEGRLQELVRCPGAASWCGEVESLDWSRDGRKLALSVTSFGLDNPYNGIHVIDLATGVDRQLRSCQPPECDWFDLAWAPDGSRLAYVTNGRIYLIGPKGGRPRPLLGGRRGKSSSPTWDRNGRRIAFTVRSGPL
jgi:dipeptidyl aminopeptidase/acylaminoacyl peptidase